MPMPSFFDLRRARAGESDKVAAGKRFFINDEKFFLPRQRTLRPVTNVFTRLATSNGKIQRPHAGGKFLFVGNSKFWVRGVTYGAFRPGPSGQEYHDVNVLERDFSLMAANGLNAVRIPHTTPRQELLDIAQ